jgi:hypothetical protein
MRTRLTAAAVALLAALAAGTPARGEEPAPRPTMHRIFDALAVLLPLSLDEARFADPAQRPAILAQLRVLSDSAAALRAHAGERDASFQFLSGSLSRDVEEIRLRYEDGRHAEAAYYLHELTQNCIACHSRLPRAREFPLASRLTENVAIGELPADERARLEVATRRFDAALATWEGLMADPKVDPIELDIRGDLVDYLTISLRVERDLPRARKALAAFEERPDVPRYLHRHLSGWVNSLRELEDEAKAPPTLELARELVARGNEATAQPGRRENVVYDLLASSVLHRWVDAAKPGDPGLSEAFYLLGLIEGRTTDSYWVPQTEFHLEAAIRADPKGRFAEPAYALLEEYVVIGHGGAGEGLLPDDVRRKLDELADLVDRPARPADAEPLP